MARLAAAWQLRPRLPASGRGRRAVRILVLGAGAIGGYFGGTLAAAGRGHHFPRAPKRAEQLARDGLRITSPLGEVQVRGEDRAREQVTPGYDAILLSCKAYDLDDAIDCDSSGRAGVGHHSAAERHAASRPARRGVRQAGGRRRRGGAVRQPGAGRLDPPCGQRAELRLRRAPSRPGRALRGAGACARARRVRAPAQPRDRAGHVGEIRFHLFRRRHVLPAERRRGRDRPHRRRARR